eukprot:1247042-Pleurochrysis_carterae.AAC.1
MQSCARLAALSVLYQPLARMVPPPQPTPSLLSIILLMLIVVFPCQDVLHRATPHLTCPCPTSRSCAPAFAGLPPLGQAAAADVHAAQSRGPIAARRGAPPLRRRPRHRPRLLRHALHARARPHRRQRRGQRHPPLQRLALVQVHKRKGVQGDPADLRHDQPGVAQQRHPHRAICLVAGETRRPGRRGYRKRTSRTPERGNEATRAHNNRAQPHARKHTRARFGSSL